MRLSPILLPGHYIDRRMGGTNSPRHGTVTESGKKRRDCLRPSGRSVFTTVGRRMDRDFVQPIRTLSCNLAIRAFVNRLFHSATDVRRVETRLATPGPDF